MEHMWVFGSVLLLGTILYFAVSVRLAEQLFRRIRGRRTRPLSASTPPPSLSSKPPPGKTPSQVDSLPPLRREALLELKKRHSKTATIASVGEEDVKKSCLPMTANYETSADNLFTPTGFSVGDVKSLGRFPDYEVLSGVPLPEAYKEFDIDKAIPRPYRPLRWAYHQTMSLTKLEPDWWLELENTYKARIEQRRGLYAKYGKAVLDSLPGSELACREIMEMSLQFLCARYPQYFSLSDDNTTFRNGILRTTEDLLSKDPLKVLMDNVPEDFGIMMRDEKTGFYFFRAGVICSSLGWNLGTKLGLQLHEIHEPIPDYKEKMQFSMDRFFSKMPTDRPIQRGSWGLEVDTPLFMPPGDPHELHRLSQDPSLSLRQCHLRVDWQTLRRLPLSGAIVFNFKAVFTPVAEFRDEPRVPALISKVLREGKKAIMEYKNTWHVEHVVLPALARWEEEQVERGLVEKDWQVSTLDESPFFPGWEEKWRRQQGF